ncbi:MAG TPA: MotA/TolQ/ExbB proton channel family protein, partial [Paraburkholderia sp.]
MPTYGITHLWAQGDPMTRFVAALLAAMSIASWSVMALKAIEFARLRRRAGAAQRSFWGAGAGADGMEALGQPGTPFFELASAGQRALAHHEASGAGHRARVDLSDWLQRSLKASVSESATHLQRGLGLLASIGSTAPFVGLLGTVWGIYHALLALGASGE